MSQVEIRMWKVSLSVVVDSKRFDYQAATELNFKFTKETNKIF
jgi:hypothetical protein